MIMVRVGRRPVSLWAYEHADDVCYGLACWLLPRKMQKWRAVMPDMVVAECSQRPLPAVLRVVMSLIHAAICFEF